VTSLTAADFELDGHPVPATVADCLGGVPTFTQSPPGTYTFNGALAAGGYSAQLQMKAQGSFVGSALPIVSVSPDINADGAVSLPDVSALAIAINGAYDPRADFDCDGVINLIDVSRLSNHIGHGCAAGVDPFD
jgi:hypothetical protein